MTWELLVSLGTTLVMGAGLFFAIKTKVERLEKDVETLEKDKADLQVANLHFEQIRNLIEELKTSTDERFRDFRELLTERRRDTFLGRGEPKR